MKIIHIFLNVVSYLFFLLLLIVGFLTLSSNTSLLGSYESLLVRSGSMEPTIMTGDVIFAKQLNQYNKNDVVAFKDEGDRVITHRIVKIDESDGQLTFITKGDANRSIDNGTILQENIIGKVVFVIPTIGFLMSFVKTPPGLIIMIVFPAFLLIIDQVIQMSKKK